MIYIFYLTDLIPPQIAVQKASYVWIDHNDLSSDRDHDKDYYDG